ncbi:MAG TPA: EamA family transporter [Gaiellaceae bacterium]|nr:EamA family transporter [Gaiellaceae bacterium]
MIAIFGGLGAAVAWAAAMLTASRASRLIGSQATLAWVMLTGLIVVGPMALADGKPAELDGGAAVWLVVAGAGNVGGLLLSYTGMRIGKVGVVAPITSAEGAVAAVVAVAAGEHLGVGTGVALCVVVAGVVLAARPPAEREEAGHDDPRAAAFALAAAGAFGAGLYATGRASADLPLAWAVLPPRVLGVAVVTLPLLAAGRLRLTRAAFPFVVASGLAEVGGFFSYAVGARHGIAIAAVLGSQFAAIAALGARVLFGERLSRAGVLGVAVTAAGVAAVSALRA